MYRLNNNPKDIDGITEIEILILSTAMSFVERLEDLKKTVIENVDKDNFNAAKDKADELKYWEYNPIFKEVQEQVMQYCTPKTLLTIAKGEPFKSKYSYRNEGVTIPLNVLPRQSSFSNIRSDNPKAAVYKLLGATIVA